MSIESIKNKEQWNSIITGLPSASGHFLQTWEWGEFHRAIGWKVIRLSGKNAAVQVIELPLPFGKKYWMCPKGPLFIQSKNSERFFEDLKGEARKSGAVFMRIEPPSLPPDYGAIKSHDKNPAMTSILDLEKSEDELLSAMHQKTRYNIKVSQRHEVAVKGSLFGEQVFEEFWGLHSHTASRGKFRTHPKGYYQKMLKAFSGPDAPFAMVFTASYQGKPLASALVMFENDTATYLHGGSSDEYRNTMAPYGLHWEIVKYAKAHGFKKYDLWGIDTSNNSTWAGFTRFKLGFNGVHVSAPGTYDVPVNGVWYSIYRLAKKFL